jgi:hypothetical protein
MVITILLLQLNVLSGSIFLHITHSQITLSFSCTNNCIIRELFLQASIFPLSEVLKLLMSKGLYKNSRNFC